MHALGKQRNYTFLDSRDFKWLLNLYEIGYVKILNSSVHVMFSCNGIDVNDLLMIVKVVLPDLVKQINYKS